MIIFLVTVFCWIFSSFISSAFGGVKDLDTVIAVSAAIVIGVTGVASWSQIQENTEWGVLMLFWWWFNTERNFTIFWCKFGYG